MRKLLLPAAANVTEDNDDDNENDQLRGRLAELEAQLGAAQAKSATAFDKMEDTLGAAQKLDRRKVEAEVGLLPWPYCILPVVFDTSGSVWPIRTLAKSRICI